MMLNIDYDYYNRIRKVSIRKKLINYKAKEKIKIINMLSKMHDTKPVNDFCKRISEQMIKENDRI